MNNAHSVCGIISAFTWCLPAGSLRCGRRWGAHAHMGSGQILALGAARSLLSLPTAQGPEGMDELIGEKLPHPGVQF